MLAQEKVTKEKGTLTFAVAGLLSGDYARALRRFADGTSVCRQRTRAHRARAPMGFFLRALAAAEREPGRARARPSWPQKPEPEAEIAETKAFASPAERERPRRRRG